MKDFHEYNEPKIKYLCKSKQKCEEAHYVHCENQIQANSNPLNILKLHSLCFEDNESYRLNFLEMIRTTDN